MESHIIYLTPAAHKYGNLNIRSCGKNFFPPDVFGGSSKKKGLGVPITIKAQGLPQPIQTDIPRDKKIFRRRTWVKDFVKVNQLNSGDKIAVCRIAPRKYSITINYELSD
ncbi:MAG: hypothetical protein ABSE89_03880 [Sedimentisphaerales bacterium]